MNAPEFKNWLQELTGSRRGFADYITADLKRRGIEKPSIVDLGCGTGALSERLCQNLPEASILAADIDVHNHQEGAIVANNLTHCVFDPFEFSKVAENKFDVMVLSGVLHHIEAENMSRFFLDINECLEPGGLLFIHEHRLADSRARRLVEVV